VCNSSPILTNLPFHEFPKIVNHKIVVEMFEEFVKRRVCKNGGGVAHGCTSTKRRSSPGVGNSPPFFGTNLHFRHLPKIYAPQTKILKGRALFKGVSTAFWATKRLKVLQKGWFGLPKSSFGKVKFQPESVVDSFDELSEMSAWPGQRYHHLMTSRYCSRQLGNR
jgi:hypothetical protein